VKYLGGYVVWVCFLRPVSPAVIFLVCTVVFPRPRKRVAYLEAFTLLCITCIIFGQLKVNAWKRWQSKIEEIEEMGLTQMTVIANAHFR